MANQELLASVVRQLDDIARRRQLPIDGLSIEVETSEDESSLVGSTASLVRFASEVLRAVADAESNATGRQVDGVTYCSIASLFSPSSAIAISSVGVRNHS